MSRIAVPLLTTSLVLLLTGSLGVWQLHRMAWKHRLLSQIAAAERAPPVALATDPAPFQKVVVNGRLDAAHALFYEDDVRSDAAGNPVMGTYLVEPLRRDGQPTLLVDLGWVTWPPHPLGGEVRLSGYVRPAEHAGALSARDEPRARRIYSLDPPALAPLLGLPPGERLLPFSLVSMTKLQPTRDGSPEPADNLPRPPDNHLQYAITWFSLGAASLVMFLIWWIRP